jgi:hypothetical protein
MKNYETKLQQIICNAIKQREVLWFYYESGSGKYWRKVAPYILAIKDNEEGNLFFTGHVYAPGERKNKAEKDEQGNYLLNKIDLNKFEVLDETFNELKLPYDRIFGKLRTIKVICRVVFD